MPDRVRLRVKFKRAEGMPANEALWAEPVDAHEGGGSYRLQNSSFVVPLANGDVVWAERAGTASSRSPGSSPPVSRS